MKSWTAVAEHLTRQRAPLLSDELVREIARDLYRAWPDNAPAVAVAKFFREVPMGWKAKKQEPEVAAAH